MKKMLTSIILAVALTGCTVSPEKAFDLINDAVNIKYEYETGISDILISEKFSDKDRLVLIENLNTILSAKSRLELLETNPRLLFSNIHEINYEYIRIKNSYSKLYSIVVENIDLYDPVEIDRLTSFNNSIVHLDSEFNKFKLKLDQNEMVGRLLDISEIALKLTVIL